MKQRIAVVLFACAALMASSPGAVHAEVNISANIEINSSSDFYQPLEPYGSWVEVRSYGRCWHPREVTADWEPYTTGHWEWTDAGWYWASDEPYGWACYHYGSWYNDSQYGWVWIPGTDWAPAWVTWRYSDDYIGWAPCGPGRTVLAASFFTFCDVHRFRDNFHSRRDFVVNNTTIINRTKVVKDFNRQTIEIDGRQRTVFANRGPGVDPIRRATGRDIAPRPVREVIHESRQPENIRRDDGQRRDVRPDQQRTLDQQRRDNNNTPPATGRDQQRNYQQPDNRDQRRDQTPPIYRTPEQQNRDRQQQQLQQQQKAPDRRPDVAPPTGRDEQRIYRESAKPEATKPAPEQRPAERTLTPTGRDDIRPAQPEHREAAPVVREPQQIPKPAPEQRKEVPTPPQHPVTPPERPLPPTGREDVHPAHPDHPAPPVQAPEARPAPPVREVPPPAPPAHVPDDGRGHDRNNP